MENLKSIKSRVKSIEGTKQITQSMKLISTAKIQKARKRIENSRPFFEETRNAVLTAANNAEQKNHPYIKPRDVKSVVFVVIGSDRGLCGGYNLNVARRADSLIRKSPDPKVITVGVRVRDYFRRRRRNLIRAYHDVSEMPSFDDAKEIGAYTMKLFNSGEADEVYLVYTKFVSMLELNPIVEKLLPLGLSGEDKETYKSKDLAAFLPDEETFLTEAIPKYVYTCVYGAMVEAAACEHSARLASMDSAVKNADKLIDDLSLTYNKLRQTGITQELTEIVGGANSVM